VAQDLGRSPDVPSTARKSVNLDLRQILRTLRANLVVAIAVFVICLAAGAADAVVPAKEYKATTLLLAEPHGPTASQVVGSIQLVIPQLELEAASTFVEQKTRHAVPARYRNTPVTITATGDAGSNSLTIAAKSGDPHASQVYADATAKALIGLANQQVKGILTLDQLGNAVLPTAPDNPRKTVLVASFVFGLIAAVFAALGAASIRRRFRQVDEVRDRVGMPVLAEVPRVKDSSIRPADIFWGNGEPGGLEAFQELRSSLLLMFPGVHPIFAVTSCDEGEGKSSVAANLAWALASGNNPVVAMDCDLRRPALHTLFGAPIVPGLSDYASSGMDNLVFATLNPNLGVISAGIPDRHPADIVSADVPQLLASLQIAGKSVVIDCPPLSGVAETMILSVRADAVVLVVDAHRFDPERLERSVARLEAAGANVAGVVLNRVRRSNHTPYGTYGTYRAIPGENGSKPLAKVRRSVRSR
jgi:capsular exopolysaccharide synthesis family protein